MINFEYDSSREELKKKGKTFSLILKCHRFYIKTANSYDRVERYIDYYIRARNIKPFKYDKSNRCSGYNYKVVV